METGKSPVSFCTSGDERNLNMEPRICTGKTIAISHKRCMIKYIGNSYKKEAFYGLCYQQIDGN